jgi:predicted nucleotidyltransferase
MGMIVPRMGSTKDASDVGLAGALFTPVQQRVLGLVFGQPQRRFQSAELIRLARGGTGAVHRQLARLEAAGWVAATRVGNQKHYQANAKCAAFEELRGLIAKTVGLVEPVRQALAPHAERIDAAFIYGSVAKGTDRATSDIDLMVLSEGVDYAELFPALKEAESALGRSISPNVMRIDEWRTKRGVKGSFAARVAAQPRLFVIGSDDDLT